MPLSPQKMLSASNASNNNTIKDKDDREPNFEVAAWDVQIQASCCVWVVTTKAWRYHKVFEEVKVQGRQQQQQQ
jgi:hypothetical protein